MTALQRTLNRHRIVIAELIAQDGCKETLRNYQEEADALSVAIGVNQLTAQADGVG